MVKVRRIPETSRTACGELTIGDAMTRELVAVGPDATADDIARVILEHHVHHVLVLEHRVLLGVITPFDLWRVLARVPVTEPHAGLIRCTGDSR